MKVAFNSMKGAGRKL